MTLIIFMVIAFICLCCAAWFMRQSLTAYQELHKRRIQSAEYKQALSQLIFEIQTINVRYYDSKVFPATYENCVQYELQRFQNKCNLIEQMIFDIPEPEKF